MRSFAILGGLICALAVATNAAALGPAQQVPTHIYSIGDSITRAFDADLPADNLRLSWVNGSHGFLSRLFGFPDVKSHQQRIRVNFGGAGLRNRVAARNGASVFDFPRQVAGMDGTENYVTVLLGGNDVCQSRIEELPTDEEFAYAFAVGMNELVARLAPGATVQVVAIPDLQRLYEVGRDKVALGIVDCSLLWQTTAIGFPCGSMLSPDNTEADRAYVRERNIGYNTIMHFLTLLAAWHNPHLYISFTDVTFTYPFTQEHVSDIDCYHPSARGQALLSEGIWNEGPFAEHEIVP